jgi:hypothetical protein
MPNDAKLGLAVGVGLVIAIAVVFFRKELPAPVATEPSATIVTSEQPAQQPTAQRHTAFRTAIRGEGDVTVVSPAITHATPNTLNSPNP